MAAEITPAVSPEQLAIVRELFSEYAAGPGVDLGYQNFADELAGLPGIYAPPRGFLLLGWTEGAPGGCVALRPRNDDVAEMKRLYVRPCAQGTGLGRALAERLIEEAKAVGYRTLWLDTLPGMERAQRLYERLGFVRRAPYFDSPVAGNVFMELTLRR